MDWRRIYDYRSLRRKDPIRKLPDEDSKPMRPNNSNGLAVLGSSFGFSCVASGMGADGATSGAGVGVTSGAGVTCGDVGGSGVASGVGSGLVRISDSG